MAGKAFSRIAIAVAAAFSAGVCSVSGAAPADFETDEYRASNALEVINASEAYDRGYTGAGIAVGVIDEPVWIFHPELAGKSDMLNSLPAVDFESDASDHGTHVAGIIAAGKDGVGMHGVAFDAGIWSLPFLMPEGYMIDYDAYFAHDAVRIYNNSWGPMYWEDVFNEKDGFSDLFPSADRVLDIIEDEALEIFVDHFRENPDSVGVFAAGNEGQLSGYSQVLLPRYLGNGTLSNFISVTAVDPRKITRTESGTLTLSPGSTGDFSNLAYGAELYTVTAPGTNIRSTVKEGGYALMSGTSMATPVVSGVVALVAQAHPWLTGKQLADAVLSTANNTFEMPDHFLQINRAEYVDDTQRSWKVRLIVVNKDGDIDQDTPLKIVMSDEEITERLRECYEDMPELKAEVSFERFETLIKEGSVDVVQMTREQIYGQGIVDAAKAVQGIARLDANRLTADDVYTVTDLEEDYALETFDTKGYTSEFSNDITERSWDDKYHHPEYRTDGERNDDASALYAVVGVGLLKTGAGTLILSGHNTYAGATLVNEGTLVIARRPETAETPTSRTNPAESESGVLAESSVVVYGNGTLAGDGRIDNLVINQGTVAPGYRGNTLTVGSYQQSETGTLRISFDQEGNHTALQITGEVESGDINGTLAFAPQSGAFFRNDTYVLDGEFISGGNIENVLEEFDSIVASSESATLSLEVENSEEGIAISVSRPENAYSQWAANSGDASLGRALAQIASNADAGEDMQDLIAAVDWSEEGGTGVGRALQALSAQAYDEAARSGVVEQNEFNTMLLSHMLSSRLQAQITPQTQSELWARAFRSDTREGVTGYGLMAGFDRTVSDGLTIGAHFAVAERKTEVKEQGATEFESRSAHLGAQVFYGPSNWNGTFVTCGLRLGVHEGEMDRFVGLSNYSAHLKSDWTQLSGSAFFGAGKDWGHATENGGFAFGPLAWADYAFIRRPSVEEDGSSAARLDLDSEMYDSLLVSIGGHAEVETKLDDRGSSAGLQELAAWRHEVLKGTYRTSATFGGDGSESFYTSTELSDRDALLLQTGFRLNVRDDFYARLDVGGEVFREDSSAVNFGLTLGWKF